MFPHRWHIRLNTWQSLVFSFLILIAVGTILLMMPWVEHSKGLGWLDALFTSTSAVCVTGLTVVPTSGFNLWGQLSILLLIQLGALGIMTLTSSFLLAMKGRLSLRHRMSFSHLSENYNLYDTTYVLKNILKITFITELAGFLFLALGFHRQGLAWGDALYQGLFHSVSAFCNAGFSPYDDSLTGTHWLVKITTAFLIITGGLGYFVIIELMTRRQRQKLSIHSRIVLITTTALVLGGTLLVYLFEKGQISGLDAFFQSVTTRTAGFNTVDLNALHGTTIFLFLILMFIGASPGSTGGGIKTTNFFIMIYTVLSVLKGKQEVVYHNRTISTRTILKAFATTISYFIILSAGTLLLMDLQEFGLKESLFEAVSAMGTVGLSLGITPLLGAGGKWVIIILMFVGRLGPASFALAVSARRKEIKIQYPEAEIY